MGLSSRERGKVASHELLGMVEKPGAEEAPSIWQFRKICADAGDFLNFGAYGGRKEGEHTLTDALHPAEQSRRNVCAELEGKLYDVGDRFGSCRRPVNLP